MLASDTLNNSLSFNGQTWLITGAAGFLGFNTAQTMLSQGATIVGLDNWDPYYTLDLKKWNLEQLNQYKNFHFITANIEKPEDCELALRPFVSAISNTGGLIHLAARAGVRPSISQPVEYLKTNVEGTANLLEWSKKHDIKRWVFASSSSVYGDSAHRAPFNEEMNIGRPVSPYAATKAMGEQLLHTYHHLHDFSIAALRFFTVYGPSQRPDLAVHKFAKCLLENRPIPVYGDGSFARDYTYVTDTVAGILASAQLVNQWDSLNKPGYEIINLGNNKAQTVMALIAGLEEALDLKANLNYLPHQPGDVTLTCADSAKAKKLLGYESNVPFQTGLKLFASWCRDYYQAI